MTALFKERKGCHVKEKEDLFRGNSKINRQNFQDDRNCKFKFHLKSAVSMCQIECASYLEFFPLQWILEAGAKWAEILENGSYAS